MFRVMLFKANVSHLFLVNAISPMPRGNVTYYGANTKHDYKTKQIYFYIFTIQLSYLNL